MRGASQSRLRAMVIKELWAVLRDRRNRITLILPPLLQLALFGFASTLEVKHFTLGIENRDNGSWSRELINQLAGSTNVKALIPLRSNAAVAAAINERQVIGVLIFEENFSANVAAGRPALVQALYDGRRSNAAQIVNGYVGQIIGNAGAELRASTGLSRGGSVVTHWFNPNLDYLWFTMPSLIVTIAALSVLSVTAQSVARERELGTFDQLLVSPLRTQEIMIGKIAPALLLGLFNASVYLLLIPLVFGVPFTGSIALFYLALVCYLTALIGVGLLVSILSQTQQQAFLGMFLAVIPLILLSGFASPVDNMPHWLQLVAQADPLKHFLIICEGVFLKGMPAADVLANTWPLLAIAALTLTGSTLFVRSRLA
ncbi:MAG: ABC transporter permease [Pseudomonadota bacterium]|nr:ABC transporter permease [Pseudomonadota bacterium]